MTGRSGTKRRCCVCRAVCLTVLANALSLLATAAAALLMAGDAVIVPHMRIAYRPAVRRSGCCVPAARLCEQPAAMRAAA